MIEFEHPNGDDIVLKRDEKKKLVMIHEDHCNVLEAIVAAFISDHTCHGLH